MQLPMQPCSCKQTPPKHDSTGPGKAWKIRYITAFSIILALWWLAYYNIYDASSWLTFKLLGLEVGSQKGEALHFFLYDTAKIFLLLGGMVYLLAWLRASLGTTRLRDFLAGKRRGVGYLFGAGLGAVTPFCSCSSIPLFMGFSTAGIPIGITMSFLITSPMINEVAIILLWGVLGWKFALTYVSIGIAAGIIGGILMDGLKAERWLHPFIRQSIEKSPSGARLPKAGGTVRLNLRDRHEFAISETGGIIKRVWIWIFAGVGIGAFLHGFVPEDWFATTLGAGQWWSVPVSVAVGIPLYTNVTGIIPVMESLLAKGLPIGTTLAFCMSTVAASLPEILMLKQVMTLKLLALFIGYLLLLFTLVGWFFNAFGSFII